MRRKASLVTSLASRIRLPPIEPDVSMMMASAVLGSFFSSFCTSSTGRMLSIGVLW
ncbi:MAG: hypothetical protein ACYS5W_11835 [Planctomycetota bacterium]|jgi:hypothetical protein